MAENIPTQPTEPGFIQRMVKAPGKLWNVWNDTAEDGTRTVMDASGEAVDSIKKNSATRGVSRLFEGQYNLVEAKTQKQMTYGFKLVDNKGNEAKDSFGLPIILFFKTREEIWDKLTDIEHENKIIISRDTIPEYVRLKKAYQDFHNGHKIEAATDAPGLALDTIKHPQMLATAAGDAVKDGYKLLKKNIEQDSIGRALTADNVLVNEITGANGAAALEIIRLDSDKKPTANKIILDAADCDKYKSKDDLFKDFGAFEEKYHVNISRREIPFSYIAAEFFDKVSHGKFKAAAADVISGYYAIRDIGGEIMSNKWARGIGGIGLIIAGSSAWSAAAIACSFIPGIGLGIAPVMALGGTTASVLIGSAIAISAFAPDLKELPNKIREAFGHDKEKTKEPDVAVEPEVLKALEKTGEQKDAGLKSPEPNPAPELEPETAADIIIPEGADIRSASGTMAIVSSANKRADEYSAEVLRRVSRAKPADGFVGQEFPQSPSSYVELVSKVKIVDKAADISESRAR